MVWILHGYGCGIGWQLVAQIHPKELGKFHMPGVWPKKRKKKKKESVPIINAREGMEGRETSYTISINVNR